MSAGNGPTSVSRVFVLTLAIATGLSVANNYYAQPLLETIERTFHTSSGNAGLIVTAAQIGYALGLVFLLPLGDLVERRRLVFLSCLLCALGLVGSALAPDLGVLYATMALVGGASVVAQILIAFAASLVSDAERGRVVGGIMSGLLMGILLARTAAGYVAEASSWRVVYLVAAGMMAVLAAVLAKVLPTYRPESDLGYRGTLASAARLFRSERVLRRRSLYGFFSFGAFSVLWTSLAFLLSAAPYRYSTGTIGLFGLVGAAGATMATVAGRLADRGYQAVVTNLTALAIPVAFVVLALGASDLVAVVVGIVVLDLGCQGLQISNQAEIYKLAPGARSRVNAAYMTCFFVGGTLGSVGSALCYDHGGWQAVCGLGAGFGALAWLSSLGEPWRALQQHRGVSRQPPATAGTIETVAPSATTVPRPSR